MNGAPVPHTAGPYRLADALEPFEAGECGIQPFSGLVQRDTLFMQHSQVRIHQLRHRAQGVHRGAGGQARAVDAVLQLAQALRLTGWLGADETLDRTTAGMKIGFRIMLGEPAPVIEIEIRHMAPYGALDSTPVPSS